MRRKVAVVIVIVILALAFSMTGSSPSQQQTQQIGPCSTADNPCIKIVDENGKTVAKVNDFRFGDQGCIYYRMMPPDPWQLHCGGYNLLWLGPGNPPGKEGKI